MADAGELVVRITGDASGLERTINEVSGSLSSLERRQGRSGSAAVRATENVTAAVEESSEAIHENTAAQRENEIQTERSNRTQRETAESLQNTSKSIKDVGEGIDTLTKPLQYASAGLAAGGVAAAHFAIDFEDSFASVKKTVDGTPEQIEEIKRAIIDMSTVGVNGNGAIPLTTAELNELAAAGGQLGISTGGIVDFTETMAMLQSATNLVGEEGAATIARFQNVMQIPESEIRNIGSAIVDLGNNSATTEAEIAAMALRLGKYGQTVRMSAADVLGYSAALSSMGIEAQAGGSAVGRTWMAIETAVAKGGKDLQAFAKYSGKSAKEFAKQWSTDSKGAFNSLLKGLKSAENLTLALDDIGINNTQDIAAIQALVNGYDLVAESVDRANSAYAENTALQTEFAAAQETTASQLQLVRNNFIEVGRSLGEVLLPIVRDVSAGLIDFAQGIANMSDEQKRGIINTAGFVIGLGLLAKGVVAVTNTIGGLVGAVGKIRAAFAAGGALSGLAGLAGPIGITTLAVAGLTTAFIVGKQAWDRYQYEQLHFAEKSKEAAEAMKQQKSAMDEVNNYSWEFKDLQVKLNSDDISEEEKNKITERMKEIAEWFEKNYDVKLNVESGDVEVAAENVEKLDRALNNAKIETKIAENKTLNELMSGKKGFDEALQGEDVRGSMKWDLANAEKWEKEAEQLLDRRRQLSDLFLKRDLIQSDSTLSQSEKDRVYNEIDSLYDAFLAEVYRKDPAEYARMRDYGMWYGAERLEDDYNNAINKAMIHSSQAETTQQQIEEYTKAARDYIQQNIDGIADAVSSGEEYAERLSRIGYAADLAGLSVGDIASKTALAQNGFDSFFAAAEAGDDAFNNTINNAVENMKKWGASSNEIAMQTALMREGFTDLSGAVDNKAVGAVADQYIEEAQKMGVSTSEIVKQAALIKNGFTDIDAAIKSGDIDGTINDIGQLGTSMGMSEQRIDSFVHSLGLVPGDKHIEFTENGFEVVDGEMEKLKELSSETIEIVIDADGNVEVTNKVTEDVQTLENIGAVSLQVNADGNIELLNEAGEVLKVIKEDPSATVIVDPEVTEPDTKPLEEGIEEINGTEIEVVVGGDTSNLESAIQAVGQKGVTIAVRYQAAGEVPAAPIPRATGTQYFTGGLAMVNDQRGIADPRELIIDRGQAFIPQGRDVVLPLTRGAKIYTAEQTQRIMAGIGIPHYAGGKDNSDAFTSARDEWSHYTKTHAVTTADELNKWLEFQQKFKNNQKDIWDIEEQIFSLRQKMTSELNKQSAEFIKQRSALNDWEAYGDTAIDAFRRVRDRNMEEVNAMRMTWTEFKDTMSGIGSDMYSARRNQSEKWLEHEEKYNGMSAADYLAGIDRMREYTSEYYMNGIISHQEYVEAVSDLDQKYLDKRKEQIAEMFEISKSYISDRTYFNDWDENGDDPIEAYRRVQNDRMNELNAGELTQKEYDDYMSTLGSDMLKERIEQSKNWLEEQRKYFNMSEEDYTKGIERIKKYTQQYYDEGLIDRREYNEALTDLNHMAWDEAENAYETMLANQSKYISELRDKFQKEEQALRDSWDIDDRAADMATISGQLKIYSGAVTDRGQQKYKELQEQMKQLRRDEELYNLQVKNNTTIERLEKEYADLEEQKKTILAEIATANTKISEIVGTFTDKIDGSAGSIVTLLRTLIGTVEAKEFAGPVKTTEYSDRRSITNNFNQIPMQELLENAGLIGSR